MAGLDIDDKASVNAVADLALSLDIRNMPADKRAAGGFLTLPPTFGPQTLSRMATLPSVVARSRDGQPVGFMLASEPVPNAPSPTVRAMQASFAASAHGHRSYAVYGPVGVAASHQGQGVAPKMFADLLERTRESGKEVLVGFVDTANAASLGLHTKKLGFEVVSNFNLADHDYAVIVFDKAAAASTRKS